MQIKPQEKTNEMADIVHVATSCWLCAEVETASSFGSNFVFHIQHLQMTKLQFSSHSAKRVGGQINQNLGIKTCYKTVTKNCTSSEKLHLIPMSGWHFLLSPSFLNSVLLPPLSFKWTALLNGRHSEQSNTRYRLC